MTQRDVTYCPRHTITHLTYHITHHTLQELCDRGLQHLPCCRVQMLPGDCTASTLYTAQSCQRGCCLQLASVTTLAPLPASGHQRNYTQPLYTATIMHALIVVMTNGK